MRIAIITLILLICTGCQSPLILHPIDKTDIIAVREGETITAPKDGFFLSAMYVEEVLEAKVR